MCVGVLGLVFYVGFGGRRLLVIMGLGEGLFLKGFYFIGSFELVLFLVEGLVIMVNGLVRLEMLVG